MYPLSFGTSRTSHPQINGKAIDQDLYYKKRQLVLSIKTTGFFPTTGGRIFQIAILELFDRQLTDNFFYACLNPEQPIGESELMHGFSDTSLKTEPLFMDVIDEIEEFVLGAEVIAHNAKLDMHFLDEEVKKCGREPLSKRIKVTNCIEIAKAKFPNRINTLDVLAERLNVFHPTNTLSCALARATTLANVYVTLTREADNGEGNQDPLYEEIRSHVIKTQKVDATAIRYKFLIGSDRVKQIIYALEKNRIISTMGAHREHIVH